MSINLIYPGRDTAILVPTLVDDWLISGPIRACIFLSNVWHLMEPNQLIRAQGAGAKNAPHYSLGGVNVFGPNNLGHPWSQWATHSFENYSWLYFFAVDMCEEYIKRFPHVTKHGISRMLSALETAPESLPEAEWDEPSFAFNVKFES